MEKQIMQASGGKRSALLALFESNAAKIYFVAHGLLRDDEKAADICADAFDDCLRQLKNGRIETREGFSALLMQRVLEACRTRIAKADATALQVSPSENFLLPPDMPVSDEFDRASDFFLANLPTLPRLVFLMHAVAQWDNERIARFLKLPNATVQAIRDAEAENLRRLHSRSAHAFSGSLDALCADTEAAARATRVAPALCERAYARIEILSAPSEAQKQKRRTVRAVVCLAVCLCVLLGGLLAVHLLTRDNATYYADIEIENYGTVTVKLDPSAAPITCANFIKLANDGFYDGLTFHRIKSGFMMQGGDPKANGTGGSGETIKGEFSANGVNNPLSHTRGAISMARGSAYDSASSQFFIVHADYPSLDGQYAVFGYVVEGMNVV